MTVWFVEHDTVADLAYPQAAATMQRTGTAWLARLAETACTAARTVRVRLSPDQTSRSHAAFRITVGAPYELTSGLLIPTRWQATSTRGLFSTMEADLRICPTSDGRTRLCLQGRCTPPLGHLGGRHDEPHLHRFVETSIDAFLAALARALGHAAAN